MDQYLDPLSEGKSHCRKKLLSVTSAFIFVQPDERLSDFKRLRCMENLHPFQMWGTESQGKHIQTGD